MNSARAAWARRLLVAGALVASLGAPARAGLFDDEEARRRIEALRQELAQQGKDNEARINRLEETVRNINIVELLQQIEQLNAEIAKLRGQLEVLGNDNQQIQKRQRDFYLDLDSRLKRLEGGTAAPGTAAGPGTTGTTGTPGTTGSAPPATGTASGATGAPGSASDFGPPPGGAGPRTGSREDQAREVKAYDAASNLFRRNDFSSAVDAFRAFLRDHPASALVPNAEYWIGISYANMKDYKRALAAQEQLVAKHPQSPKVPDALLAIASIQAEQGDTGSGR